MKLIGFYNERAFIIDDNKIIADMKSVDNETQESNDGRHIGLVDQTKED